MITACISVVAAPAAFANPARAVLARFACEPEVGALQRAAARFADLQPERSRSLLRRARAAALLPTVRARIGDGPSSYVSDYPPQTDEWRFSISATWRLDRMLFDRSELAIRAAAERTAELRQKIYAEVARLYYARLRLEVQALGDPADRATPESVEHAIAIDELTALLDGLTGGALTHPKGVSSAHE